MGKGNCFKVNELGPLLHLQATLIISLLENAVELRAARNAKLIEKPDLIALCLEWSVNVYGSQNMTSELEVHNMQQPHKALKELTIRHYGSITLQTWLKDFSFPHIVLLNTKNSKNCSSLPLVGQLPSQKIPFHQRYGKCEDCLQAFRSLETLSFTNMKERENWILNGEFPRSQELSI